MIKSAKRASAKALFRVAGLLSRIKTPRRTYTLVSTHPFVTEPSERRWLPCETSVRLIKLSMRLDWEHWDHWACVHDDCHGLPCPDCGGVNCYEPEGN